MKITKENLEGLRLTKNGTFRKGNHIYRYEKACACCGNAFLVKKTRIRGKMGTTKFCCSSCAKMGSNNPNFGKPLSVEHRQKISESGTGKKRSPEFCKKMSDRNADGRGGLYKGGVVKNNIPLYSTYGDRLLVFEEVRIYMVRVGCVVYKSLQIRCTNASCRVWFRPTRSQVTFRLQAFIGNVSGSSSFYCSRACKETCSVFGQKLWPRYQNPNDKERPYTNEQYQVYRGVVMGREDYTCEYCGKPATDVHHEKPRKTDPMFVLDPDYGHACCRECHMKYGHKIGTECGVGNLANKVC